KELIRLFRHPDPQQQNNIYEQNQILRELLTEADDLANHEDEIHLVSKLRDNLVAYLTRWDRRALSPDSDTDVALAHYLEKNVLDPAIQLRAYIAYQVEYSDLENRAIVNK